MTDCPEGRKPKLKGKPKFRCKQCGLKSHKKKHLCKGKKL